MNLGMKELTEKYIINKYKAKLKESYLREVLLGKFDAELSEVLAC